MSAGDVKLSKDVAARLAAEATRRAVSIDELAGDIFGRNLPPAWPWLRFGASGQAESARERMELVRRWLG